TWLNHVTVRTLSICFLTSSASHEAYAVWEGLKWCVEQELDRVIIESDAQAVR
ncbi:hypothetical protein LINGRAHAP2_LOCUS36170, partial [Linum grandiflorum]